MIKKILLMLLICISFVVSDKVSAAEIVKQSGNVFSAPQIVEDGVKVNISGTVRYLRHTKYSDSSFGNATAHKQLKSTARFTATKYSCPGYYISRAYSDNRGSNLVGYAYIVITQQDVNNPKCASVDTSERPTTPTKPLNATHPVATKVEKSKMISQSTNVSPTSPKTVENPEIIKESDRTETIEPTPEELDRFFEKSQNYDACLDDTYSKMRPAYMSKNGGQNYDCVDMSDCYYPATMNNWYCNSSAKNFTEEQPPQPTTVHYDIPDYSLYRSVECDDNSTSDDCNFMDQLAPNGKPTGSSEMKELQEEPEEPQQPTQLHIAACKGEYEAYGLLFDGVYQMPWEYKKNDIKTTNASASVDPNNRVQILLNGSNSSVQVGNSNTLKNSDFIGASPCPTSGEENTEMPPQDYTRMYIKACMEPGTTNKFNLSVMFDYRDNGVHENAGFTAVDSWSEFPNDEIARMTGRENGAAQFVINDNTADFAFSGVMEHQGSYFYSNRLTASQIKQSGECTTQGEISDPGNPPVNNGNEEIPDCYCPKLENFGAGLGFMCCIFECPGLQDIISDGKQFLSDDLVGTATAPEVPEFNPPPMPNIFDVLNNVENNNQPAAPIGQNAPGLENAGFTANDVNNAAPEIEFREDDTGGFNIVDPIANLPADGSTAPRPKESTAEKPELSGSGNINENISYPKSNPGTAKPPGTNGTAKPPGYSEEVNYPSIN